MKKRILFLNLLLTTPMLLISCGTNGNSAVSNTTLTSSETVSNVSTANSGGRGGEGGNATSIAASGSIALNEARWSYDATNNVYYQIGQSYCSAPVDSSLQTMGIFVPGNYFTGTKNSDGTYTCQVNASGTVASYTASTAPIVFPVNTPGYASQAEASSYSYSSLSSYLKAGFIYVQAGMRGKNVASGQAPWGVTDLKAAIRDYRYNASKLPGSTSRIFTFGMSGGGAQSSLMGASGDSPLYTPYLESIGAPLKDADGNDLSDAVAGAMCWCPITSLDEGDEAYEWNMGQFFTSSTRASGTFTKALSDDMASAYADFINGIGLKNNGETLALTQSSSGIYLAGSYFDYIVSVIKESLNNYLADTYGTDTSSKATYVSSLGSWASFDSASGEASIADLGGFIKADKQASKSVGAFDSPSRNATENTVFRSTASTSDAGHFDAVEKKLLEDNKTKYAALSGYVDYTSAFAADFASTDTVGKTVSDRSDMYNPMYYLDDYYQGYNTSKVASYWRIRTGINQTDTALTTEANLALALQDNATVSSVDFATVWGKAHTEAERSGNSSTNFISWVEECAK